MTFWDWLWAWTRDAEALGWLRTVIAGVVGALIGGLFSLWGQARQARNQMALQKLQFESERESGDARWELDRRAAARIQSLEVARELFEHFTALQRSIQAAKPTLSEIVQTASWGPKWREIWTEESSLNLDVRARLIADEDTRQEVQRIVQYLDRASSVSLDTSACGFVRMRLREIVGHLTAEGIEFMGAYIRGDIHVTKRPTLRPLLDAGWIAYGEWEDNEIRRAESEEISAAAGSSEYPQEP